MSNQPKVVIPSCSCGGDGKLVRSKSNLSQMVKCETCGQKGPVMLWEDEAIREWDKMMKANRAKKS